MTKTHLSAQSELEVILNWEWGKYCILSLAHLIPASIQPFEPCNTWVGLLSENCLQGVATGMLPATWMSTSHLGGHRGSKHKKGSYVYLLDRVCIINSSFLLPRCIQLNLLIYFGHLRTSIDRKCERNATHIRATIVLLRISPATGRTSRKTERLKMITGFIHCIGNTVHSRHRSPWARTWWGVQASDGKDLSFFTNINQLIRLKLVL